MNSRADAAINIPIVEGKLAIRGVVDYEDLSGWIDRPAKKDANGSELRNYRFKVNAEPTDALSVGLSAWIKRDHVDAPPTSLANGTAPELERCQNLHEQIQRVQR